MILTLRLGAHFMLPNPALSLVQTVSLAAYPFMMLTCLILVGGISEKVELGFLMYLLAYLLTQEVQFWSIK